LPIIIHEQHEQICYWSQWRNSGRKTANWNTAEQEDNLLLVASRESEAERKPMRVQQNKRTFCLWLPVENHRQKDSQWEYSRTRGQFAIGCQ